MVKGAGLKSVGLLSENDRYSSDGRDSRPFVGNPVRVDGFRGSNPLPHNGGIEMKKIEVGIQVVVSCEEKELEGIINSLVREIERYKVVKVKGISSNGIEAKLVREK